MRKGLGGAVAVLCRWLMLAAFLCGCSATPAPPTQQQRVGLGHVAVLALSGSPNLEFQTFAKGWASGAAKGGSLGLVHGFINSLAQVARNPPSGPYAGAFTLVTMLVATTVGATVYGVAGGREAVPTKTARRIEQDLAAVIGGRSLADDLVQRIVSEAQGRPELAGHAVIHLPVANPSPDWSQLAQQGINTVVEIQLTEAGFRGGSGAQPEVSLYLNAHVRLVATATGTEMYGRDFQYVSRSRPFPQWFSTNAAVFTDDFSQGLLTLADRVVDELFLVTRFPFASGLWTLPGQPEFGICWFRPLYPEVHYTSLLDSMRRQEAGIRMRYTAVDSVQPLLRWEPMPRPRDLTPKNERILRQLSDVSYDMKLWEVVEDFPVRLLYDVSGLREPQFRPPQPLPAHARFFWTFRARYRLADQPQVTRWAFSNIPSNTPIDYPQRSPGGMCDLDGIPATNYFRFATP